MLTPLLVLLRSIGLICRGHRAVALENLALRQQLAALTRTTRRPQLRTRDRLFWILLAKAWQEWRTAIMIVQPDTVVRWHRQWLRRQWTDTGVFGNKLCRDCAEVAAGPPHSRVATRSAELEQAVPGFW